MTKQSYRFLSLFGLFLCIGLLTGAAYLQFAVGLQPCPLCILQRVIIVFLGLLFLAGALHMPTRFWRKTQGVMIVLTAGLGAAIAGKHIWLQRLPPDQLPPCLPDFNYVLETLPLPQALQLILRSDIDCARDTWTLFHFTLPEWNIFFFSLFIFLGLWYLFKK